MEQVLNEVEQSLIDKGYVPTYNESTYEDIGDGENGPELTGGPAFTSYVLDDNEVIVVDGKIVQEGKLDSGGWE